MFDDNRGSLGPLTEAAGAALAELGSMNAIARICQPGVEADSS